MVKEKFMSFREHLELDKRIECLLRRLEEVGSKHLDRNTLEDYEKAYVSLNLFKEAMREIYLDDDYEE